jgi:hypothetical protein
MWINGAKQFAAIVLVVAVLGLAAALGRPGADSNSAAMTPADSPAPRPGTPRTLQVLYLEGAPRAEYRMHRTLLERDNGEKVKPFGSRVLMQNADPESLREDKSLIDAVPGRAELARFHIVILGDVDPAEKSIGKDAQENLARFVRDGGALVVIAGSRHTPHAWKKTALTEVLPIELGKRLRRNG